jgi:hypothetical protein
MKSEKKPDKSFWDRTDQFIQLANEFCDSSPTGQVSSSILYAAARFNAFIVASSANSAEEIDKNKEAAVKYFTGQYRKMFEENLDEYSNNFKKYIQKSKP